MAQNRSNIAFIGLGTMGLPMACNLAKQLPDTKLYIYDIVQECIDKVHSACPEQVVPCQSAVEAASQASIILTMVPEGKHVRSLYLDPQSGLISTDLSSKILIDCSTIDLASSIAVKDGLAAEHPSASFYDAPVSGGSTGAAKGTLTFMLGCSSTDPNLPVLESVLEKMGASITPCGGHSLGLTAKLCNNYCSGLIALATAETFNIAMRSGLDPRVLQRIFRSSTAGSCINDQWHPVPGLVADAPSNNDYQPGFKVELMAKDFGLAVDIAKDVGAKLVLADKGLETYEAVSADERYKGRDSRVVYRWLEGREDWEGREELGL